MDLWANAVWSDDVTVVDMFGALDIDSLQFETRLLLRRLRILTGESEDDAIRRALEERYQRLTSAATTEQRATRREQHDYEENPV